MFIRYVREKPNLKEARCVKTSQCHTPQDFREFQGFSGGVDGCLTFQGTIWETRWLSDESRAVETPESRSALYFQRP